MATVLDRVAVEREALLGAIDFGAPFDPGLSAGLLGGALTTTPTLAAAQDAVRSGLVSAPAGFTDQQKALV